MQTFLPYRDFKKSASCLDRQRLGKQRVEAYQIFNTINGKSNGWANHPVVLMWKGYSDILFEYTMCICYEWINRGYKDSIIEKMSSMLNPLPKEYKNVAHSLPYARQYPPWLGLEKFHGSHRANLLKKDPIWYGQFGWTESPDLPYYWPTKQNNSFV